MLTPQKIQDLADPIESIYISMTNELMVNIGKHITSPTWTHTAAWEIQKLSELGQLTAENAAIINEWIAQIPDEIRETMEETRRIALEGIEQDLSKAADKGYLTPPMRDSTYDVLNEYGQQAADKLNMVNTTMLESSVEMYKRGIAMVMSEEQAASAQNILNEETGEVVSGTETRTKALQRAIGRMNDEGITGFYDRAGRSWSAEAYVNMDIRTTVHNTAIQSVKNRMNDYGAQVFQVSAHAGARPLCYPYQGKLYSWNDTAGVIEDGNGKKWHYEPLKNTTYKQAAGLFGVNCGHSPIPIIPGVSIPHAQDYVQPKDENDKAYAESQEQRALERKIRNAKRAIDMGDDSPEAKQRVKDAQREMREFIDRTGRTRRYDRESLYSGKKAPTPPADQRPQNNKPVNSQTTGSQNAVDNIKPPKFTPAKTQEEAEQFAKQWARDVNYKGISLENCNKINETLNSLTYKYPIRQLDYISQNGRQKSIARACYADLEINGKIIGSSTNVEAWEANRDIYRYNIEFIKSRYKNGRIPKDMQKKIDRYERLLKFERWSSSSQYGVSGTIAHEYGHILADQYFGMLNGARAAPEVFANSDSMTKAYETKRRLREAYKKAQNTGDIFKLSQYGDTNEHEFFAEMFSAREHGEKLPDYIEEIVREIADNGPPVW